jgi:hypothetical protein
MFTIETDPARSLVRVRMAGFMSPDEVEDFSRAEQAAVAEMGLGSGEFLLLVDTVGAVIQSQETVAAFAGIVADSPLKARRIAVVRANTLTRMQTQRILMVREDTAIFSTLAEAEAWLFAEG